MTSGTITWSDPKPIAVIVGGFVDIGPKGRRDWGGVDSFPNVNVWNWNTYSCHIIESRDAVMSYWSNSGTFYSNASSIYYNVGVPVFTGPPVNDVDAELWAKMSEKIRGHSFNAAITLAEAPKSVRTILDGAKRIATSLRYVRKGRVVEALRELGVQHVEAVKNGYRYRDRSGRYHNVAQRKPVKRASASKTWLDMQYGWKPLLNDAYSAGQAAFAAFEKPQQIVLKVGRTRFGSWHSPVSGNVLWSFTPDSTVRSTTKLVVVLKESLTPTASLGLIDPEVVAWELVPFSFVADWFLPIGNYLEGRALTNKLGTSTWATTSFLKKAYQAKTLTLNVPGYKSSLIMTNMPRSSTIDYVRTGMVSFNSINGSPVPFPGFKSPVNTAWPARLATNLALMRQLTRR